MMRGRWRAIDVLVVVGVVVLVITLVLPAVQRIRAAHHLAGCQNHLRMLAMSIHNASSFRETFPQGTLPNPRFPPEQRLSWYLANWGWTGDGQIGLDVDWEGPWDTPQNRTIKTWDMDGNHGDLTDWDWFDCPARPADLSRERPRYTAYVGMAGLGVDAAAGPLTATSGIFGYDRACPFDKVTNGLSSTLMVIETNTGNGPWTAGGPSTVRGYDLTEGPPLGPGKPFGGLHLQGTAVLMADGSFKFLDESMDPQVFSSMLTIGAPVEPAVTSEAGF
jgi:hypothetical protein